MIGKNNAKMTKLMLGLAKGLFHLPRFTFNHELFKKLIMEKCRDKEALFPEVKFEHGPIDGVAGYYNRETKRIVVDLLEIYMISLFEGPLSQEQLYAHIDEKVTQVLSHEGAHWVLDVKRGKWAIAEKIFWYFFFLVIIGFPILMLLFLVGGHIQAAIIKLWTVSTFPFHSLVAIAIALLSIGASYWTLKVLAVLVHAMANMCSYRLCYHERYARDFSKKAEKDPRWDGVIT